LIALLADCLIPCVLCLDAPLLGRRTRRINDGTLLLRRGEGGRIWSRGRRNRRRGRGRGGGRGGFRAAVRRIRTRLRQGCGGCGGSRCGRFGRRSRSGGRETRRRGVRIRIKIRIRIRIRSVVRGRRHRFRPRPRWKGSIGRALSSVCPSRCGRVLLIGELGEERGRPLHVGWSLCRVRVTVPIRVLPIGVRPHRCHSVAHLLHGWHEFVLSSGGEARSVFWSTWV